MMRSHLARVPRGHMLSRIGLGLMVAFFNLKGFLAWAAVHASPSPGVTNVVLAVTHRATALLAGIAGPGDAMPLRMAHWLVSGFWWYLAATLVGGVLLWKPMYSAYSVGGLFSGLLWFPIACWAGFITFVVVRLCVTVTLAVVGALTWFLGLFAPLVAFLGQVFAILLPWIAVLVLITGVFAIAFWAGRNLRGKPLALVGLAVIVGLLGYAFFPSLAYVWVTLVQPALHAIGGFLGAVLGVVIPLLGYLLVVVVTLALVCMVIAFVSGLLGLLGWLLADQFRAAWLGGTGKTSMFLSGFSVGTATAMVLMVCIGHADAAAVLDGTWHTFAWLGRGIAPAALFAALLPASVESVLATLLQDASAPVFDGLLLLALFACAGLGMFRLGEQRQELPLAEYLADGKRFGILSGAALTAPLLVVLFALAPSEDG